MVRLRIENMSFGPYGVAHLNGKAILMPKVAPGDLVEAEVTSDKHDYALARVVRILERGSDRRQGPCPYVADCGGCDWQQINYVSQTRIKAAIVASDFKRVMSADLEPEGLVDPAPAEFGYRSRIRLMVGGDGAVGYRAFGGNQLVKIEHCPVAAVPIGPAAEFARMLVRRCREIEVVNAESGVVLIAHLARDPTAGDRALARRLISKDRAVAGVILKRPRAREVIGDVAIKLEPEPGCELIGAADHFSQVNHAQNQKLVAQVMELARLGPDVAVIDLFCGCGNFSLPAARRGAVVTGIDADELAIKAARENALRMKLSAQFIAMAADGTALFLRRAHYHPSVAILDPPRTGAFDLMKPLAQLEPERIIYVSCNPRTLLRDIAVLTGDGYRIGRVKGFDFFPNTHHIELVAELYR